MIIPFGGIVLHWDVYLNDENYEFAPDFNFKSDIFLADPTLEHVIECVPSLLNWDIKNPNAFKEILIEFLEAYKKVQVNTLFY